MARMFSVQFRSGLSRLALAAASALLITGCGGGGEYETSQDRLAGGLAGITDDAGDRKSALDAARLTEAPVPPLTDEQALRYIASYPDLMLAFGTNVAAAKAHYANNGRAEGRVLSFDAMAYIASYPDLIEAFGTSTTAATAHYIAAGRAEGRTVSFDGLRYIASHADLIAAFGTNADAATLHYVANGYAERRRIDFDALRYIASHRDLIAAFGLNTPAATAHYIVAGSREGRSTTFNAFAYLNNYPDLIAAFGTDQVLATRHYILAGSLEGRSDASVWAGIREGGGAAAISFDSARAVATDAAGNVFIAGSANGSLTGDVPGRGSSAFVAKYNQAGILQWARKFPTTTGGFLASEVANGVALDSSGNVYAVGVVNGTLPGQLDAGSTSDGDVALVKFDSQGNLQWARQFGSAREDAGNGIAIDAAGSIFIVGQTSGQLPEQSPNRNGDMFIAKFDLNGNRLWLRQSGSSGDGDWARSVVVDAAGNAYMTGTVDTGYQNLPNPQNGQDAFVAKYAGDGSLVWFSRIPGRSDDYGRGIAVTPDGNTIYLTGSTNSNFDAAGYPQEARPCCTTPTAFMARLNGLGTVQWIQNLRANVEVGPRYFTNVNFGVTTDASGSAAYIVGYTNGVMPGALSQSAQDIVVARYESTGALTWLKQFGAGLPATGTRDDVGYGIALNPSGDLFVVGESHGTFGTPNPSTDREDWFVMKLRPSDGAVY